MNGLFEWLSGLPPSALYPAMFALAAAENVFPPLPADLLVGFGGFLAARSGAAPWPAFLSVWTGNVLGALGMYAAGRMLGAAWTERRFHLEQGGKTERRIVDWYARGGAVALTLSRFVPALRAVVPPLAGALRMPLARVVPAIVVASGAWYGTINWIAFRAGTNWDAVKGSLAGAGRWIGIGSLVALVAWAAWRWHRARP